LNGCLLIVSQQKRQLCSISWQGTLFSQSDVEAILGLDDSFNDMVQNFGVNSIYYDDTGARGMDMLAFIFDDGSIFVSFRKDSFMESSISLFPRKSGVKHSTNILGFLILICFTVCAK
jgi:hypothetical protein